jgi:hypothetical protein
MRTTKNEDKGSRIFRGRESNYSNFASKPLEIAHKYSINNFTLLSD